MITTEKDGNMMKIYGSMLCKDCVACCAALDAAGVGYTFLSITDELQNLKDFLRLRDGNPLFDDARAAGSIGIPYLVLEDGTATFTVRLVLTVTLDLLWERSETDGYIDITLDGQAETFPCDGNTIGYTYEGASVTMKKK